MTQAVVHSNRKILWPVSIAGSLLLQLLLANILWHVCTSYDHRAQPQIQVININPAPPDKILMPETITEKPLMPQPQPPAIEAKMPSAPEILQPEVAKPPVAVKTRVKPSQLPLKKPARAIAKTSEKQQVPSETNVPATPVPAIPTPVTRPTTVRSESAATLPRLPSKTKAEIEPGKPVAAIPASPTKDFSPYLQKIYRIIERNKRYPAEARRRGLEGKVLVSFSINAAGKATGATAQNTVAPELQQAALKLLGGQTFPQPPPDWDNQARITMTINYSIR